MSDQSQNLNISADTPPKKKEGYVIALLIITLLILTGGLFYINTARNRTDTVPKQAESKNSLFAKKLKTESSSLVFPGFYWQKRFTENLDKFIKESSSQKQFELLTGNFDTLKTMYTNNHDPKTRKVAEDLGNFIRENYIQDYTKNASRFKIVCLDSECTKIIYTKDLEELISLVKAFKFKNYDIQKSILTKIDTATLANNSGEKFNYFNSTFLDIQSAWQEEKNPKALEIAQKLQEIIKNYNPSLYKYFEKEGYYKL